MDHTKKIHSDYFGIVLKFLFKVKEMKKTLKLPAIMLAVATFAVMLESCKETEDNNDKYTVPAVEIRSLKLSYNTANLVTGDKDTLTVTFRPDDAPDEILTWISSDEKIISVTSIGALSGELNALSAGTAIITVKTAKGVIDICEVTVADFVPLTGISIAPSGPIRMETGNTDTLYALRGPANATYYTPVWTSSNPAVVTVSETGVIHAAGMGDADITVSSGNVSASVRVEIVGALESISITPAGPITLPELGTARQLDIVPVPANAVIVNPVWTSDDPNVISVSQTGLATAVGTGTATVTVTSGDIHASVEITVNSSLRVQKYIKGGWTASSNHPRHDWAPDGGNAEDAGEPKYAIDNDKYTGWHTNATSGNTDPPYVLLVDMKSSLMVDSIEIWHHPDHVNDWIYWQNIEIYLVDSDTPVEAGSYQSWWGEPAATHNYTGGYNPVVMKFNQTATGRYLILYFPNSTQPYISCMEVEVFRILQ
jgi:uncharacterized protein YjdB